MHKLRPGHLLDGSSRHGDFNVRALSHRHLFVRSCAVPVSELRGGLLRVGAWQYVVQHLLAGVLLRRHSRRVHNLRGGHHVHS
ncbi:hypothetical protein JZU56_00200, partial [bacterium]|nr:hypothetical protein [bacterium]